MIVLGVFWDIINSKYRTVKENDTLSVILVIKGLNFLMY